MVLRAFLSRRGSPVVPQGRVGLAVMGMERSGAVGMDLKLVVAIEIRARNQTEGESERGKDGGSLDG